MSGIRSLQRSPCSGVLNIGKIQYKRCLVTDTSDPWNSDACSDATCYEIQAVPAFHCQPSEIDYFNHVNAGIIPINLEFTGLRLDPIL
jgi:hypothetical protein